MPRLRLALARIRPARIQPARLLARLLGFLSSVLKIGLAVAALAVLLLLLGTAVSVANDQFGFHPEKNTRFWAGLTPAYAQSALCQKCHAAETATWSTAQHKGVACEACHGPLAAHVADATIAVAKIPRTNELCAACHTEVLGRPAALPQHDPKTHYIAKSCLQCHSAHSTTPTRPLQVVHTLANLPECTICHGPKGMKAMPAGHEVASDNICLGCHGPAPAKQP